MEADQAYELDIIGSFLADGGSQQSGIGGMGSTSLGLASYGKMWQDFDAISTSFSINIVPPLLQTVQYQSSPRAPHIRKMTRVSTNHTAHVKGKPSEP